MDWEIWAGLATRSSMGPDPDETANSGDLFLVCRIRSRLCALPIGHVIETMRPLPVQPLARDPHLIRGVAIIRGAPVPVVDIARVVSAEASEPTRFVTVNTSGRPVALAVDSVVGVRAISAGSLNELTPLLRDTSTDAVAAIGTLDDQLLMILHSARLVPEEVWSALDAGGVST